MAAVSDVKQMSGTAAKDPLAHELKTRWPVVDIKQRTSWFQSNTLNKLKAIALLSPSHVKDTERFTSDSHLTIFFPPSRLFPLHKTRLKSVLIEKLVPAPVRLIEPTSRGTPADACPEWMPL
ncbi:hypothetical protein EVAR_55423_1 [Eumeta japonica]|uniref:Uncharacterized protein n=1 Tax=Eumeta variegata TaxID=151549 RepID=A0A4C1Z6D1_EUMVA|nr:hypothetical protein EVAR_55423_1 [Eumeta japonica]